MIKISSSGKRKQRAKADGSTDLPASKHTQTGIVKKRRYSKLRVGRVKEHGSGIVEDYLKVGMLSQVYRRLNVYCEDKERFFSLAEPLLLGLLSVILSTLSSTCLILRPVIPQISRYDLSLLIVLGI
jgi:hypothetical protein